MNKKPLNETPLVYLVSQARFGGCKEIADKAERMAELLAMASGELVAVGSDANEAGSVLRKIHEELGYT